MLASGLLPPKAAPAQLVPRTEAVIQEWNGPTSKDEARACDVQLKDGVC